MPTKCRHFLAAMYTSGKRLLLKGDTNTITELVVCLFSEAKGNNKSLNIYENQQIIISWEIEK